MLRTLILLKSRAGSLKHFKAHCIHEEDPLNDRAIKNILIHEESYPLDPAHQPVMAKRPTVLKAPSLRFFKYISIFTITIIFKPISNNEKETDTHRRWTNAHC